MDVLKVGAFIRGQRTRSRLSLRHLSSLAGVSIPYLSQVERGLRKPSADILQAIAKALRISAETLYVQAGILEDRPPADVAAAIMSDPSITERHKQALLQIYEAFRQEGGRGAQGPGQGEGRSTNERPERPPGRRTPGARPGTASGRAGRKPARKPAATK